MTATAAYTKNLTLPDAVIVSDTEVYRTLIFPVTLECDYEWSRFASAVGTARLAPYVVRSIARDPAVEREVDNISYEALADAWPGRDYWLQGAEDSWISLVNSEGHMIVASRDGGLIADLEGEYGGADDAAIGLIEDLIGHGQTDLSWIPKLLENVMGTNRARRATDRFPSSLFQTSS